MGVDMIFGNLTIEELNQEFPNFYKMLEDEFDDFYHILKDRIDSLEIEQAKETLFAFLCNIALSKLYSSRNEVFISNVKKFEKLSHEPSKISGLEYTLLLFFIKKKIRYYVFSWLKNIIAQSNETPEEFKYLREEYIDLLLWFFDKNTPTNRLLIHACQIYYDNKSKTYPKTKRTGIFQKQAIEQAQEIGQYLKSEIFEKRKKYLQKEFGKLLQELHLKNIEIKQNS